MLRERTIENDKSVSSGDRLDFQIANQQILPLKQTNKHSQHIDKGRK